MSSFVLLYEKKSINEVSPHQSVLLINTTFSKPYTAPLGRQIFRGNVAPGGDLRGSRRHRQANPSSETSPPERLHGRRFRELGQEESGQTRVEASFKAANSIGSHQVPQSQSGAETV